MKGEVAEFVGADIDPVIFDNPELDRALLIESIGLLDLESNHFEVIFSGFVLEHVETRQRITPEAGAIFRDRVIAFADHGCDSELAPPTLTASNGNSAVSSYNNS